MEIGKIYKLDHELIRLEKIQYEQSDLNIGMTYDEYLALKEQKLK